jgi:glucoamylase
MSDPKDYAPGAPGLDPYRAGHVLSGLGKSLSPACKVTFTLAEGIVSEVCFMAESAVCAHDLEWIVTDSAGFFSAEKQHTHHDTDALEAGIPAYKVANTCRLGKYRINKEIITDPLRDTLLQKTVFTPLESSPSGKPYRLYLLLTPHIGEYGDAHTAWTGEYKGIPMLFARKGGVTMALACSHPWKRRSVGYTGVSDGWMDLAAHRQLTREYRRAESGSVAMVGEVVIPQRTKRILPASEGREAAGPGMQDGTTASGGSGPQGPAPSTELLIALGFGEDEPEAAAKAWTSLLEGFEPAKDRYMSQWRNWQHTLSSVATGNTLGKHVKTSALVLRLLEARSAPGALQAGLFGMGLVRPRDLGAAFGAYMALDAREDALRLLGYIMSVQEPGGYWTHTMQTSGAPVNRAVPLDQVAQVILMVDASRRSFSLTPAKMNRYWEIVLKALSYLVCSGPSSPMDRWGGNPGISTYSLTMEIAALLAAADMAEEKQEPGMAAYCRKTADYLYEHIDQWTFAGGAYRSSGDVDSINTDSLILVRYGLRKADDPRILETIRVIDAQLKVNTPYGPSWKRFSRDSGAWPLLTAERAHYELAAGNRGEAEALLATLDAFAFHGFLPEQVWNESPKGTVIPLAWAHAEYILLCCSLKEKKIMDTPRFTRERYLDKAPACPFVVWRFNFPCDRLPEGKKLRIEVKGAALIHWTDDDWATKQHTLTRDTRLGIHIAELVPGNNAGRQLTFTFMWLADERWENKNYFVSLA